MPISSISPQFGALICHNDDGRRCPETGVRIFRYELTNDTRNGTLPLGRVFCPQSGKSGRDHAAVAVLSASLPQLAKLDKEDRLEIARHLIRQDSHNWEIGKNQPEDQKDECLADRGKRLLQQSTADIIRHADGSHSMIMDYDLDLQGKSLTQIMEEEERNQAAQPPRFQGWA